MRGTGFDTVVVTGASSGIGAALARAVAPQCRRMPLVARRSERLGALAAALSAAHRVEIVVIGADLSRAEGVDGVIARLADAAPAVDLLVNNAGLGRVGAFAEMDPETIESMLAVNMVAPTRLARAVLPGMVARGRGALLNVASTSAFQPGPGMAVYFASKAYLLSWSRALRAELKGTGVTVTALCPGPTDSEFAERAGLDRNILFRGLAPVWTAEQVAGAGLEAVRAGRAVVVPGVFNKLARIAPTSLAMAVAHFLLRSASLREDPCECRHPRPEPGRESRGS